MKTREVIQRVQSLYSKGVQSDDSRLSKRHIFNKVISVRSKLISQGAKKRQKVSQWNYQVLPCVELIEVPEHQCPCVPPVGCKIYRTKEPIPDVMVDLNRHLIQSVTSIDGSHIFSETTWFAKKYKSADKYTGSKPDYFVRDGYIYITNRTKIKYISITALFEDPEDVWNFPSACEEVEDCTSPLDREFPMDNDLVDTMIEMSVQELFNIFVKMSEDQSNNAKDNIVETSK